MPAEQRRQLGAFIRTHRARLTTQAAGLPVNHASRRRTPGLRREEVAQICGVSTTWYTWMEQGRDISISPSALARLADALHLSEAERAYLFELARKRDPAAPAAKAKRADAVPSGLAAALEAMTVPAYLLDRLWRAKAWNAQAARLFSGWLGGEEPCLLRYVFLDKGARSFICDFEDRARRLLAEFRADTAEAAEDAEMLELVEGLRLESPLFARLWDDHAVLGREGGMRMFEHPEDGLLRYEQVTLVPAIRPDHKLVMLLPGLDRE
ncbi:transcriptional regulator, XRE family [Rhizobiales bacterium GAS191]|nr:transcriptional regulator, XRE family [Rhizobiales bacterium GAS113]SEE23483.1 transcriptional regulator, XRE family [Rhizobiales bacterium GAS191]SEE32867.1 transcriptional regulator, XRE family [Rhizobiales bacterium GAS188]